MNLNAFRAMVDGLWVNKRDGIDGQMHMCVGLAGESGECLDMVKKTWVMDNPLDRPIDMVKLQTEAGDVLHYLVGLCIKNGWTLEDLAANNHIKMQARYPGMTYSDAANIARADVV